MMRPGSSVVELTPFQFETGRGSFVFSTTNSNVNACCAAVDALRFGCALVCGASLADWDAPACRFVRAGLLQPAARTVVWPWHAATPACPPPAASPPPPLVPLPCLLPAAQDATSNVLWWVAVVCDPAASTPGPNELARRPPEDWWPRDRNARVPWALLEAALREAVVAGGSQQRYLEQYYRQGLHKWHLLPGGALQWGGRCPNATHAA